METEIFRGRFLVQSPSLVDAGRGFSDAGNRRFVRAALEVLRNVDRPGVGGVVISRVARDVVVCPERRRATRHGCSVHREQSAAQVRAGFVAGRHVMTREVQFTPLYYCLGGMWDARVVLLHELFHVRRGRSSVAAPSMSYPNGEEFLATTVANMYRSQLSLEFRKGYLAFADPVYRSLCPSAGTGTGGGADVPQPSVGLSTTPCAQAPSEDQVRLFSRTFAARYRSVLRAFATQEDATFRALVGLDPWFNPFRDL